MKNYSQAMSQIIKEQSTPLAYIVGTIEDHSTNTGFGCVRVGDEEIMIESRSCGAVGEVVILEIGYAHKFKRAVNVCNFNRLLEMLNYKAFYSEDRQNKAVQEEIEELKRKAVFLRSHMQVVPKLSHSAEQALTLLK